MSWSPQQNPNPQANPWQNQAQANPWQQAASDPRAQMQPHPGGDTNNIFIRNVFGWMTMGLMLTAFSAYAVFLSPALQQMLFGGGMWIIMLLTLGMVFGLSFGIQKLSPGMATGIFLAYSILNGLWLAPVLFAYTATSVGTVFLITAATFGFMFVYGWTTKKDLTSLGSLAFMGLIGIIIAMLVNMFFRNDMMSFVISILGVLIFVGLTAYDAQKLKEYNAYGWDGSAQQHKSSILGALTLYLDFINLFLFLLRLLGDRR